MKELKMLLLVVACICFIRVAVVYGQGNSSKESISANTALDVKNAIENLSSEVPQKRWFAAHDLGEMKEQATPAIPHLIASLKDTKGLVWHKGLLWEAFGFPYKGTPTSVAEAASEALNKITGKDFGKDQDQWQKWWELNKRKLLKGR